MSNHHLLKQKHLTAFELREAAIPTPCANKKRHTEEFLQKLWQSLMLLTPM